MVAVADDRGGLPVEAAHEIACGDEDLARHVLREVAREIGVRRRHVLGGGASSAVCVLTSSSRPRWFSSAMWLSYSEPVDNRVFAPGQTTFARTPCSLSSAAMASVNPLTPPLPAG